MLGAFQGLNSLGIQRLNGTGVGLAITPAIQTLLNGFAFPDTLTTGPLYVRDYLDNLVSAGADRMGIPGMRLRGFDIGAYWFPSDLFTKRTEETINGPEFFCNPELTTGLNNGTSWENAWRSFANVGWAAMNTASASTPVYLSIKKGTTAKIKISPSIGGTDATNRLYITTQAIDEGADPVIRVSSEVTSDWADVGSGVYSTELAGWTRNSLQCWQDTDTPLAKGTSAALDAGFFWLDTGTSPYTLYVHCSDGMTPTDHVIELSTDAQSAYFGGTANFITMQKIKLQHGDTPPYATVRFYTCNDVVVEDVVHGPASGGCELRGTNIKLRKSTFEKIWNGKNYSAGGGGSGISINGSGGGGHVVEQNIVRYCYVGLGFTTPATGVVTIKNNLFYDNLINCISCGGTVTYPLYVYNNTIYHAPDGTAGYNNGHALDVQTTTDDAGLVARNNLIVVRSDYDAQCILISRTTYGLIDVDHNHYYRAGSGGHVGNLAGVNYTSMVEWVEAVGLVPAYSTIDTNSDYGDPLLSDVDNLDFRITSDSPCVGVGVDLGLTSDITGEVFEWERWLSTNLAWTHLFTSRPIRTRQGTVLQYTGDYRGMMVMPARTNLFVSPGAPVTQDIATTAQQYAVSCIGSGSLTLSGAATGVVTEAAPLVVTASAGTLTVTKTGDLTHAQVEAGAFVSTPIGVGSTSGLTIARAATVASYSTVDRLRAQNCVVWLRRNAPAAGQTAWALNSYTDASNETGIQFLPTSILFRKRVGAADVDLPLTFTHIAGFNDVQLAQTDQGMILRASDDSGATWTEWATNASVTASVIAETVQFGRNGDEQLACSTPFTATAFLPTFATLAEYQSWVETNQQWNALGA